MPDTYFHFDGHTHRASDDAHTAGGELIPYDSAWSHDQGDDPACPDCFPDGFAEPEAPAKPAKKAKKA